MNTPEVQAHFRAQVSDYHGLMRRLIPFYDEQRQLMQSLMPFDRGAELHVLDLGCGPGLMAAEILAAFPDSRVMLVDVTAEMIELCKARLGADERATYQVGDFRTEDFGSGYDLIIASLSLHHLHHRERPRFFRRLHDSLSPGGWMIAAEMIIDESKAVREQQYEMWRRFMDRQGEIGDVWYQKHVAKDHPLELPTLVAMLNAAGFEGGGCFWRYLNFAIVRARKG